MPDCLFCRIVAGELPSRKVYEDEEVVAFRDIQPVAPTHILVVPRRHLDGLAAARPEDAPLLGRLLDAARRVAEQEGLAEGYRVVVNQGAHGGQSVGHLHLHVLGGRSMQWPPG